MMMLIMFLKCVRMMFTETEVMWIMMEIGDDDDEDGELCFRN